MGCAIGMSVAAACELIYWLTLKPVVKLMISYNVTLSANSKYIYNIVFLIVFLAFCTFSFYSFQLVYYEAINRDY